MRVPRTRALVAGSAAALTSALLTGCAGNPQVELSQAAAGSGTASTVSPPLAGERTGTTLTATVTATVVARTTVVTPPTVTVTVTAPPPPTYRLPYDQIRSTAAHQALVGDIGSLDTMTLSGPVAASALMVLSGHLSGLLAMAAPPGLDPPSYFARVMSLKLFADAAAQEAQARSPQAPARYVLIRRETGALLAMVDSAIGATLTLPAAPTTTPQPLLTTR